MAVVKPDLCTVLYCARRRRRGVPHLPIKKGLRVLDQQDNQRTKGRGRTDVQTDGRIEEGEGRVAPFAARATDRDRASERR